MKRLIFFSIILIIFIKGYCQENGISDELHYILSDIELKEIHTSDFMISNILNKGEDVEIYDPNFIVFLDFIVYPLETTGEKKDKVGIIQEKDRNIIFILNNEIIDISKEVGERIRWEGGHVCYVKSGVLLNLTEYLNYGVNKIEVYMDEEIFKKNKSIKKKGLYAEWIVILKSEANIIDNELEFEYNKEIFQESIKGPVQLTNSSGWKKNIRLSPNDEMVAFELINKNISAIKIINFQDPENPITVLESKRELNNFAFEKFYSFAPCWSIDSRFLYFLSNKSGNFEVYRAKVDFSGNPEEIVQLTELNSNLSDLILSPDNTKMFFVLFDNEKCILYNIENPNQISSKKEFMKKLKPFKIEKDGTMFSPVVSDNGKYLVYCYQNIRIHSCIRVIDLGSEYKIDTIEFENTDCLYPTWSPVSTLFSFYGGHNIYKKEIGDNVIRKVSTKYLLPEWAVKPLWDKSSLLLYYISNDKNQSIKVIDFDQGKIFDILNTRHFTNNIELDITTDSKRLVYTSFQSGNCEIWYIMKE